MFAAPGSVSSQVCGTSSTIWSLAPASPASPSRCRRPGMGPSPCSPSGGAARPTPSTRRGRSRRCWRRRTASKSTPAPPRSRAARPAPRTPAADQTGREIERTLLDAAARAGLQFFEEQHAIDLIMSSKVHSSAPDRVLGAYALDTRSGEVNAFVAKAVVLATGGAGKVYLYTSNPDVATRDGIAMAHRAGAAIANLEFIQFHPTVLYHPQAKSFLISEALRGEGGVLRNKAGEAFMERYDPRRELAPRDVVALSIDSELKRRGDDCVFLDMRHLGKAFLVEHFPHIYTTCLAFGIDMAVMPKARQV